MRDDNPPFDDGLPCGCGSNLPRSALYDAADNFCCYVCDSCEAEKRKRYNPVIFRTGTPYARSGEEQDIFADYDTGDDDYDDDTNERGD